MKKKKGRKKENYQREQVVLALERTILSKERTVLTEITVLLGFMTLGILIIKFFENSAEKLIIVFGFVLVAFAGVGILLSISNFKKYTKELKKIEKNGSESMANEEG